MSSPRSLTDTGAAYDRERDYWKAVAIYLADCHAATAEADGSMSGVSKSRKKRYASICALAAEALQGGFSRPHQTRDVASVAQRCLQAAHSLVGKDSQ